MHLLSTSDICVAFNNKVVLTDDRVIVETTYVSALPKVNRQSLAFLLGTRWGVRKDAPGLLWGPKYNHERAHIVLCDVIADK